jgi:arginine decarboxylase
MPSFDDLDIEPVLTPRDAFFGPWEDVPVAEAVGRVTAEQITPYPPGIPALVPGQRITAGILDYLRTGVAAGMVLPDSADAKLETVRVVALP